MCFISLIFCQVKWFFCKTYLMLSYFYEAFSLGLWIHMSPKVSILWSKYLVVMKSETHKTWVISQQCQIQYFIPTTNIRIFSSYLSISTLLRKQQSCSLFLSPAFWQMPKWTQGSTQHEPLTSNHGHRSKCMVCILTKWHLQLLKGMI